MKNLTHEEWVLLNKQTDKVLAEWYSILNNWGWIKELGLPEDPKDKKNGKRMAFMKAIKRL